MGKNVAKTWAICGEGPGSDRPSDRFALWQSNEMWSTGRLA
jgi:hypothetical protein